MQGCRVRRRLLWTADCGGLTVLGACQGDSRFHRSSDVTNSLFPAARARRPSRRLSPMGKKGGKSPAGKSPAGKSQDGGGAAKEKSGGPSAQRKQQIEAVKLALEKNAGKLSLADLKVLYPGIFSDFPDIKARAVASSTSTQWWCFAP